MDKNNNFTLGYISEKEPPKIKDIQIISLAPDQLGKISPDIDFLIYTPEENILEVLHSLRKNPKTALTPFFLNTKNPAPKYADLVDGCVDSVKEAADIARLIGARLSNLPSLDKEWDPEKSLLYYLYSRPDKILTAQINWHSPFVAFYPLAALFFEEDTDLWSRLMHLKGKKILEFDELVDQIQSCPSCYSGMLTFQSKCPNCHSIRIKKQPFLHCFSCGTIAPQEGFIKSEGLFCPQCLKQLRHIGIDYDRPLEDNVCEDCNHQFIEEEISAKCLVCTKSFATDKLITRDLHSFKLSKNATTLIKGLELDIASYLKDQFNYVVPEYFSLLVKWNIDLKKRYPELKFSLMALNISNIDEIKEQGGIGYTYKLLDEFYQRLRSIFRDTDVCTRQETGYIFFFLPQTDSKGLEGLEKKLHQFLKEVNEKSDVKFDLQVTFFDSDSIDLTNYNVELILSELKSNTHALK